METHAIQASKLTRSFGEQEAVKQISFSVPAGEIFAFLGPNGAGKTTTIAMLTTLMRPTSGTGTVAGHDIVSEQAAVRKSIGVVFQEPALDTQLTAYENLEMHTVLFRVPAAERKQRIGVALETVGLQDRAHDQVERFSGGMKRRLEIARALTHTPRVLFLDEPTLGLDPQTRNRIWETLHEMRRRSNLTIFFTTHYMEEAEFADQIAIIDAGKIIALDSPDNLKKQLSGDVVYLSTHDIDAAAALIEHRFGLPLARQNGGIRLEVRDAAAFIPHLVRELDDTIQKISLNRPTLEDVFLKLTGHAIRDANSENGRGVVGDDPSFAELHSATPADRSD